MPLNTPTKNMFPPTLRLALSKALFTLVLLASPALAQTTLYYSGGTTNIIDGTAVVTNWANMSGTWGGATKNFATDTNGTTYAAWSSNSVFRSFSSGYAYNFTGENITNTIISDVAAAGIALQFNAPSNANSYGNKAFYINASNAYTLTLSGTSPVVDVRNVGTYLGSIDTIGVTINQNISPTARVQLAGSSGFTKTGNLYLQINNTNDALTGTVNVLHNANSIDSGAAGTVQIGGGGANATATLAGITRFNISAVGMGNGGATTAGVRSRLRVLTGTNNANVLNDSAVISLTGLGQFEYQSRTNSAETIGSLRLASSGVLRLDTNSAGTTAGALTFTTGIDRANTRAQLLIAGNAVTGEMTSTVNLGTSHGLGNSLLPWATDSRGRFMKVDTGNYLVYVAPTDVSDVSTITSSSTDYRITGTLSSSTFASGAQANSIGIYRGAAGAYTLNVADTLVIASGGLVDANDNNATTVTIQGGSSLTTAGNATLYISAGVSSTGGAFTVSTPITGNIDVAVNGGNAGVSFGGTTASTYTGTTYVNGGTLTLNRGSSANAVGSNVVIRSGAILAVSQNENIPNGATVTVENGGFWNRGGSTETIASLAGGGMLTANTNSTAVTTVTNSVTIGDSGIGTMIVSSASNAGITNAFRMNSGAVFNMELSANGGMSDQMQFWNFSTNEFVLNSNAINLSLAGTQTNGRYTASLFKFYSDGGTNLTSSFITNGLTIGTTGTIIGTPTLNYNSGGSTIDVTYNVGAMFYTNGTTYTVSAAENYDAATYIRNGTTVNANVSGALPTNTPTTLVMDDAGSGSSTLALGANQTVASVSGAGTATIALGANTLTVSGTGSTTFSGTITGTGGSLTKSGSGGTLTLSGASANTYSGTTTVSGGVLELNKSSGEAIAGNLIVGKGTTDSTVKLLLSGSNQVGSTGGQTVTLSGGTIQRASGVSEVFGNLNITAASFLDFGTGTTGNLQFGTYTPSSLITVQNFLQGNTLKFATQLTTEQLNTNFSFDNGFTTNWSGGTFTITAIPEPSTLAAAIGLAGMMLWPVRRRLLCDAKHMLDARHPEN